MSRGNNASWAPLSWWIRALYKSTYYIITYYIVHTHVSFWCNQGPPIVLYCDGNRGPIVFFVVSPQLEYENKYTIVHSILHCDRNRGPIVFFVVSPWKEKAPLGFAGGGKKYTFPSRPNFPPNNSGHQITHWNYILQAWTSVFYYTTADFFSPVAQIERSSIEYDKKNLAPPKELSIYISVFTVIEHHRCLCIMVNLGINFSLWAVAEHTQYTKETFPSRSG